ncbi:unnamed protein product [Merluccius merluccius]
MNLVVHAISALFSMRAREGSHPSVEEEVEVVEEVEEEEAVLEEVVEEEEAVLEVEEEEEAAGSFCPRPQNTDNECSSHWKISAHTGPRKQCGQDYATAAAGRAPFGVDVKAVNSGYTLTRESEE